MSREVKIPHAKLTDGHTTTVETERAFKAEGLDLHVHEVEKMDDDYRKKERILKIKNTKYFFIGR
jgi:hypothetical protein